MDAYSYDNATKIIFFLEIFRCLNCSEKITHGPN